MALEWNTLWESGDDIYETARGMSYLMVESSDLWLGFTLLQHKVGYPPARQAYAKINVECVLNGMRSLARSMCADLGRLSSPGAAGL